MRRFRNLFTNIESNISEVNDKEMILTNGTVIQAFPSNSESIRGITDVGAIFMDEAAHFKLVDDSIVLDAVSPIVETNKSDLFMISTPNGPRGFFYKIDNEDNDYYKPKFPISVAKDLYTQEEIDVILNKRDVDVEQEYLNQYTTSKSSVFGSDFVKGEHGLEW